TIFRRMSHASRSRDRARTSEGHAVQFVEPPSCSSPALSLVFIGRNHRGQWVAQEQNGRYGGLVVNRFHAIKNALAENGYHPEAIVELSREIELDTGCPAPFDRRRIA